MAKKGTVQGSTTLFGSKSKGTTKKAPQPSGGKVLSLAAARRRRKSPAKGWAKKKPAKKSTREKMPKGCFLDAKNLAYPICPKNTRKKVKPSCKALAAARGRACQQGKSKIAKAAYSRALKLGCPWTKRSSVYVCPSKPRYGKVRKKQ